MAEVALVTAGWQLQVPGEVKLPVSYYDRIWLKSDWP